MSIKTITFIADNSGGSITFNPINGGVFTIDSVSLKKIIDNEIIEGPNIKEFLSGNTDEGREIEFRADSQIIQLMSEFENFATPLAIVTKLQRGSLVKCFVALGDEDFYELEGEARKGTTILKIHSIDKSSVTTPPIAREIRISWRDSSKQLCRLTQGGVIFLPTTMSRTE